MADASESRQLVARVIDEQMRADFKAWVSRPEYQRLIKDVGAACARWKETHPDAVLLWIDTGLSLVFGDPAVDSALGLIAGNDDAKACLRFADHETNHQATVLTMQLALIGIGWVK